jgi:drug/metabolite transporter (DMT)-like permease
MFWGAVYGIAAAAIWGGMYVVSDVVLKTIPPFTLLNLRVILGLIVLALLIRWQGHPLPTRTQLLRFMAVGIVGFGFSLGAQFLGTDLSTAVNGALVTSASPAFMVLFGWLILREKLTLARILAVTLATIGVVIIVNPAEADFSSATFAGDVFLAIAALTWGLYSVLSRWVLTRKFKSDEAVMVSQPDTLVVTAGAFLGGLCITLPAAAVELTQRSIGVIDGGTILGVLYLGIISTALAMWLWNKSLAVLDASIVSLFFFAQPLTGALLGALFLAQPMTTGLWVGSVLITAGVLLSLRGDMTDKTSKKQDVS